MRDYRPRVYIGQREVAGYYSSLHRGFQELGIESVFVSLSHHPFHYSVGSNPRWARAITWLSQKLSSLLGYSWPARALWVGFFQNVFGLLIFPWVVFRYDVFIFASVSTFFFFTELPILRLLKKKIIFVFNGSDTRPVYLNGYVLPQADKKTIVIGLFLARIQKLILRIVDHFADHIVNIPPQAHFHSRPCISGYHIGLPCDYSQESRDTAPAPASTGHRVRVLHAPSKPGPKGTERIRGMITRINARQDLVDLIEVIGRPHKQVLEEIKNCDFVVDELYSDTPMAGLATEAAFFGKPSVVGSYYASTLLTQLRVEETPPSIFCHPDEVEAAIEHLAKDATFRRDLGVRAQTFVQEHWAPRIVAEKFLKLVSGTYPQHWAFNPYDIRYTEGCGLSQHQGVQLIRRFLQVGGRKALCLHDKPELEALLEQKAQQ